MEAIKAQIDFVEAKPEVVAKPTYDAVIELNELELAMVGGGGGDVHF
jgi:hypothetical protein